MTSLQVASVIRTILADDTVTEIHIKCNITSRANALKVDPYKQLLEVREGLLYIEEVPEENQFEGKIQAIIDPQYIVCFMPIYSSDTPSKG